MAEKDRKRVFSGIQPTNTPTLGNYFGPMQEWVKMQENYDCIYSIVDLHSITVRRDPAQLRRQVNESYALLLAMGVDPVKSIAFVQSHNPAHAELSWLLSCYTQFGELSRMTQFKDKSEKHPENINAGLFTYPVLMAADILLYQTDVVPVGIDQKQHVEITRDIAERFNNLYGETFTMPEPYIPEKAAKIGSLTDPTKKMSKSDENPNASVSMLDDRDTIIRKFKRAVTDSGSEVRAAEGKEGIVNLMVIYRSATGKSFEEIEEEFKGKGYGDFKLAVGESVADRLQPIQEEYKRISSDKGYIEECMKTGAERAQKASERTLKKAYKKVGFIAL